MCSIIPSSLANNLFGSDMLSEHEQHLQSVVSRPDTEPHHHNKKVSGMSHCNHS